MQQFIDDVLEYHSSPTPGKLSIQVTKPTANQRDLSFAYTPWVAEPVRAIARDPENAYRYTSKGNLVAVVSNGTAILGLGNLGALASKPVMEGKAVLFKRFANVDSIDIEVDTEDPEAFIETVANIGISFGGINLEDIKAPECFVIEETLKKRLNIPVFHDDQHGTAVVISAALLNALELQGKNLEQAKIVCLGAGAAGNATMRLLTLLGAQKDNILMVDRQGVIHSERTDLNEYKAQYAPKTDCRTLGDALKIADVFIGLSGPNLLSVELLASMPKNPIVFALANPDPEIKVELAKQTRSDLIMATGRSDYPNQVNNVLCFPYIFRGALDVRASCINDAMLMAATHALKDLVHQPIPETVRQAYLGLDDILGFGPEYILPKAYDPRLKDTVSKAVALAARESGVAKL
ncbi:MAG: malic enzyme-like NAD(P)-binding protein [Gammaproteobacteria bacterium]